MTAKPGGDPGQIERQSGAAGHHQMAEHPLGKIHRPRRTAQGGGNDEAEDVHHAGDEAGVNRVAAGRAVGLRVEGVREQPDDEKERRYPDVHHDQRDHEPATLWSSMNLVAIMAPLGIGDPRWSRGRLDARLLEEERSSPARPPLRSSRSLRLGHDAPP